MEVSEIRASEQNDSQLLCPLIKKPQPNKIEMGPKYSQRNNDGDSDDLCSVNSGEAADNEDFASPFKTTMINTLVPSEPLAEGHNALKVTERLKQAILEQSRKFVHSFDFLPHPCPEATLTSI